MSTPTGSHPAPKAKSGSNGALVAVLVLVPLAVFGSCAGLCGGLITYRMHRTQTTLQQTVQQITQLPPPLVSPPVNDWWTSRMLAPVYTVAIDAVGTHPEVIERLGEPVGSLDDVEE